MSERAIANTSVELGKLASGESRGQGQRHLRAPQELTQEVHCRRPCCQQVRHTDISTACAHAPTQVRLPPHTFRRRTPKRIASSARQLVASSPGWRRKVNRSSRWFHRCWAKRSLAAFVLGGKSRSDSWFSRRPRTTDRPWVLIWPPA